MKLKNDTNSSNIESSIDSITSSGYNSCNPGMSVDSNFSTDTTDSEIRGPNPKYRTMASDSYSSRRLEKHGRILDDFFLNSNEDMAWKKYEKVLPTTLRNMESKLCDLIQTYSKNTLDSLDISPCEKFAAAQLIKIAHSICLKSLSGVKNVTAQYFTEVNSKIDHLLEDTIKKSPKPVVFLEELVRKIELITCDAYRIIICIENNPFTYDTFDDIKGINNTEQDLQTYILKTLGDEESATPSKRCSNTELNIQKGDKLFNISVKLKDKQSSIDVNDTRQEDIWAPRESDFTIIKLISQGAYGAVFLVRHNTTQRRYAMKKILKTHALLKNQARQIFAERDILSFIDNPFIISMFCSFETKNSFCMVMEYAEGGDCASLLKYVGILSLEMARIYIAETITALDYIHNYGIIHRDIKPDNMLITSLGHIKLTDFGLSKIGLMSLTTVDSLGEKECFKDKKIQGTPNYIAPEVILNKPYGKSVDYWSIGIVLYEFLVGCPPFYGNTVEEIFEAIVSNPIEWPEEEEALQPEAQDIIKHFLDRNPSSRLGHLGAESTKTHPFFKEIEWNDLLHTKTEFIPQCSDENDTSFFDDRKDRYKHHQAFSLNSEESSTSQASSFTSVTKKFRDSFGEQSGNFSTPRSLRSNKIGISPLVSDMSIDDFSSIHSRSITDATMDISTHMPGYVTIIHIKNDSLTVNLGFSIKTVRVLCQTNISYLLHIIDYVAPNSVSASLGIVSGMVILYINDMLIVGKQHIDVIKHLSFAQLSFIGVCSLDKIGVSLSPAKSSIYIMDRNNDFFRFMIKSKSTFEKHVDGTYIPVLLNRNGMISQQLNDSSLLSSRLKRDQASFMKKVIKKALVRSPTYIQSNNEMTPSDERPKSDNTCLKTYKTNSGMTQSADLLQYKNHSDESQAQSVRERTVSVMDNKKSKGNQKNFSEYQDKGALKKSLASASTSKYRLPKSIFSFFKDVKKGKK